MRLPYDMGNAGDLLKHGVLAEFVRWRCESGRPGRFMDLFGGEPEGPAVPEVARRVRALPDGALRAAQKDIDSGRYYGRYYGSGFVARRAAESAGCSIRVLAADADRKREGRLKKAGLSMLDEESRSVPRFSARQGPGAWRMTCPPLREETGVCGESRSSAHADARRTGASEAGEPGCPRAILTGSFATGRSAR